MRLMGDSGVSHSSWLQIVGYLGFLTRSSFAGSNLRRSAYLSKIYRSRVGNEALMSGCSAVPAAYLSAKTPETDFPSSMKVQIMCASTRDNPMSSKNSCNLLGACLRSFSVVEKA